jgi:O-antigen/teichoic acid export membrane protein
MLRRVLHNLLSLTLVRAMSAAFALTLLTYLARARGAQALGEFALLFSVFMLTQQLPLLGLHAFLVREAAAAPRTLARQLPAALALSSVAALVLGVVVGAGGTLAYPELPHLHAAFWLIGLALLPSAVTSVAEAVLIGQQRMGFLARVGAAENLGRTAGSLLALALGSGMGAVFAVFVVARTFAALAYWRAGISRGAGLETAAVHLLLRQVPVYLGILLLSLLMSRTDVIALSHLASMEEAGRYAAPYRVYEFAFMVPNMVNLVLWPVLAGLFAAAPSQFGRVVRVLVQSGLVFGVPAALALGFAAQDVIGLLFGQQYIASARVLEVLAGALLLVWIDQVLSSALLAAQLQRADLIANAVACAVYLPLLFYLVTLNGATGAAVATTIMWGVQVALRLWFLRVAAATVHALGGICKVALAGALAAGLALSLHAKLGYAALALGLFAYVFAVVWWRALTRADLHGIGRALIIRAPA